ncbi:MULTISPECIES: ion transporter [unclassified Marinimicrobium]|jgi:voltage-gated potassium channel|uniref:ion transporter n=1 Tax=unclassified Marinimicrobium TaxID=2632100 RepID=UPI000C629A59|nr:MULTISPECIES: ion transporter [unclassified Marinimicrobium]MAN51937.1 ion transporter [Marinimicrobium sp.]|tara:strand:- start:1005 stop:1886 length:882 start_codon:yes stop_codon:yes gene_type:complete
MSSLQPADVGIRTRLFQIIFESDTPVAKGFDILLAILIFMSVGVILLDSVQEYHERFGTLFYYTEWVITLLFTLELGLRIYCLHKPLLYLKSFYGIIDVLAVLPTWLMLILPGAQTLVVIRLLRTLRLFRVLEMMALVGQGRLLLDALKRSRGQIMLFLFTILMLVTIFSTFLYLIEPHEAGFTSIPTSIYWGIVTLTTVGYGDISPVTPLGQFISVMIMLAGYSIIALPAGVFSAEVIRSLREDRYSDEACPGCGKNQHEHDAKYCKHCGTWLNEEKEEPDSDTDKRPAGAE